MDANGLYGSSASEDGQLSCEEREDGKMLDEDEDQPGEKRGENGCKAQHYEGFIPCPLRPFSLYEM